MFHAAILGTSRYSENVRRIIEDIYNPAVAARMGGEPIHIDAYVGGGDTSSLKKDGCQFSLCNNSPRYITRVRSTPW